MTKTDWTAEEVRDTSVWLMAAIDMEDDPDQRRGLIRAKEMLTAFAERIEADESAAGSEWPYVEIVKLAWSKLRERDCLPEEWHEGDMVRALQAVWPNPPAQAAQETPCSLNEALNVIEHWGRRGNTLNGDDVSRFLALADKIAPAQPAQSAVHPIQRMEGPFAGGGIVHQTAQPAQLDCPKCHGTGEVSDSDGLYVGQCTACRAIKQPAQEQPGWKVPDNERDSERLDWLESTMCEYGDGYTEPLESFIGWTGWQQSKHREHFPGLRKALDAAMADEWNNQNGPTFMGEPVLPKQHTWVHSSKLGGDYCEICGVMKGTRRSAMACTPRPEFDGTSDPFKPEFDGTTPPKEK